MKILVIGGGGREHALVHALKGSKRVSEIVCAPGNGGIAGEARCVPVNVNAAEDIAALALAESADLVVIGPEAALAAGVVDRLEREGIRAFGPTRAAAQLESSKAFAKEFMRRWQIPTAGYAVCRSAAEVSAALPRFASRVVVKADGLAAGKGVILCETHDQARAAAEGLLGGSLVGVEVESVVLEEMLEGPEVSYFALCDGQRAVTLGFAQDHKRIGEGDTGPNTGGMGAYSTDFLVSPEQAEWLRTHVAQKVVDGMRAEGMPFRGVLFTGLMLTGSGPRVLEFNTRFGDPETEALLLRLNCDLLGLLEQSVEGTLSGDAVQLKPGAAACVIAASAGYPGAYPVHKVITGLERVSEDVKVFHAGTALRDGQVVSAGGRVLALSAAGAELGEVLTRIYAAMEEIDFDGMQFRRDIGWRALAGDAKEGARS